jgi:diguanylate cyclase (GGDEF)-like protein/PAS domain S-box-containing protein
METLSRRAEAALSQRADCSPEAFAALSPEAARQLLHDLQVRQIELELQNEELRLLQREDTPLRAHLVVSAVPDDDGVSELRIVLSEITERKRLEQELHAANVELARQSESRYRSLIKWAPEPLVVHDGKKIIFANPATVKMLGAASDKELVGKSILDLVHPDSRDLVRERLRAGVEQGVKVPLIEEKCLKIDGTPIDVEVQSRPIDFAGKTATLISIRDITERKLAEKRIQVQSERLRLLYQASQRLSSTLDLDEIYHVIDDFMFSIAPGCDFLVSAFDPDTQLITCRAFVMNRQALDVSAFPPIPLEEEGRGTQSIVIRSGKSLLLNDYQATLKTARTSYFVNDQTYELDEQVDPAEEVAQSALIVPLKVGDRVTGVVQVMSYRPNAFSEEQLHVLESLALHIASAEQNAQLYARVQSELNERKQAQAVDAFLAQAGSSPGVEPFFDALAKFLAQNLQMDYICIDRLEGDKLNATTLAVWHDGQFEDNLTYALRDTPCGDVVGQQVCCFPASVRQFFPNDAALQELHAESYIGVTLWSHTGQPIGLIAAIGRRELSNRELAEATLARVVVRASGELERLNAEAATYRSETRFRGVFEKSYAGIAVADATGTLLEVNDNLARMLEYERQELIGMNIAQFTHLDDLAVERVYLNEMRAGQRDEYRMNKRYLTRTGALIWVDLLVTVVRNLEGNAVNVIGLVVDIRERMKAEAKLQLAASVFSHAREGIIITDVKGSIIDINEAFTRITGYGREEVLGQSPRILKSGRQDKAFYDVMWRDLTEHGHWSGEIWNRRQDGETYAELLTISSVRDAAGVVQQYVGLFSDITAIKQHQSQLEHIAHFDALTSLPNRVLLADRLQQAMAQAQRREHHLAVVYLDLDGFKAINDRHGHDAGDQVLITLAQRMKQVLREGDSLARLGGDEFVAVLIDLEDQSSSRTMLTRLLAACAQSIQVGEHSLQVSASLGVTFYPQEQEIDADQLLRQADQAMYQAKLAGKSRYHMFDATLDSSIRGHHESVERIRLALENQEFVLHYQPKVNMRSGQIIGAEALIRWQHPEKGLLLPAVFLPVIEDHALAVSIGEWVIDTALTQIELWQAAGLDLKVSVNIGARQLQQSDFVDRLKLILIKHPQVMPGSLELEVLETSALEDIAQVSQVIEACAQIGMMFALDDFGTGYSSLTYLKRLRVAALKIDQSFVRDMLEDPDDLAILQGIIGLAVAFKRDVIAEGVETVEHGSVLLHLGCELAQGYGIARPMPAAQMPQWAAQWQPDAAWDSGTDT